MPSSSQHFFSADSPPNTTILVSQNDPSLYQFKWGSSNNNPTVNYKFKIKKAGPGNEYFYQSDNNGLDTVKFQKSFLDSLANNTGNNGDSALCL